MHFPKQLVTLRKTQGYTQQSLADAVGMHVNQIKKYESGTAQAEEYGVKVNCIEPSVILHLFHQS